MYRIYDMYVHIYIYLKDFLKSHGLFFPSLHLPTVGLDGFSIRFQQWDSLTGKHHSIHLGTWQQST